MDLNVCGSTRFCDGTGDAGGGGWIDDLALPQLEPPQNLVPDAGIPRLLGRPGQSLRAIFGPPGTGKTTTLTGIVSAELKAGVPSDDIAFTSFTNSAVDEAIDRVTTGTHRPRTDFPYFNTLHGLCWSILGRCGTVLDERELLKFAKASGYRLSGTTSSTVRDFEELLGRKGTPDDALVAVYEWCRARRIPVEEGYRQCSVRVPWAALQRFIARYTEYKGEHGLIDFSDMLEAVLALGAKLPVDIAIVDEAQDLSPLQAAVVEILFRDCDRVVVGGDDDQCIYQFSGADPAWMLSLPPRASKVTVLPRSFRVPAAVHVLAQEVIRRNQHRVPKQYEPREGDPGKVSSMSMQQALDHVIRFEGTTFVLARNAIYLRPWSRELMERGVAFLVEGPAGAAMKRAFAAAQTACDLAAGRSVEAAALDLMFSFVPARGEDLLPHGAKAAVERLATANGTAPVTRADIVTLGLESFLAHLDAVGPVDALTKLPGTHRAHVKSLMRRNGGTIPEPRITLSTVHRAKGAERDCVVVVPDMTQASFDELENRGQAGREAECRVAYVAVTRAREHLILVDPRKRRFFDYDSYLRAARTRLPDERK